LPRKHDALGVTALIVAEYLTLTLARPPNPEYCVYP